MTGFELWCRKKLLCQLNRNQCDQIGQFIGLWATF